MDVIDYIQTYAPEFRGVPASSRRAYFRPDPSAPYGRYWDGTPISEHPSEDEINQFWEFWVALCNADQKETLQAQFDWKVAQEFIKAFQFRSVEDLVKGAVDWWIRWYPHEYREFMQDLKLLKSHLKSEGGWDDTHSWKLIGQIPHRVKQLVLAVNPEIVRRQGKFESPFEKLFFSYFDSARISHS